MTRAVFILVLMGGTCLAAPLRAETAPPGSDDSRYSFHTVDDGFVRLDTRTGQASLCGRRTVGWSCQAMPDDRAAFDEEIARLQGEIAVLKRALLDRGLPLPNGVRDGSAPAGRTGADARWPGSAGLDRAMAFVGQVWRRLVEMVGSVQRDLNKS
ncbi:MAG TPA: hypothetical protein VHA77_14400 [Xanthobacteraceae bacterium]|nr:hypothetical protein [Xanthobacteraceae bacterium]